MVSLRSRWGRPCPAIVLVLLAAGLLLGGCRRVAGQPPVAYLPLRAALHMHTTFSDGALTVEEVAAQAAGRYDVVLYSDHSDLKWEYKVGGMGAEVSSPSLLTHGLDTYLSAITAAQQRHAGLVLLAGMEASPYYYWQGIPFMPGFTMRNWSKHLVVAGMAGADLPKLPLYAWGTSRHTPYKDAGLAPYQELIDAVAAKGGLTFWAHMAAAESRDFGQVKAVTPPHGEDLVQSQGYTGFAVNGRGRVLAEPGGPWDQALRQFCRGSRRQPVWAMAEVDYHRGAFPDRPATVVLAADRTPAAVLEALRRGRMYALSGGGAEVGLEEFAVTAGEARAIAGETLAAAGPVSIHAVVRAPAPGSTRLVRDGEVLRQFGENEVSYSDTGLRPGMHYYRLLCRAGQAEIVSNPIFVRR